MESFSSNNGQYSQKEYWNERYRTEESFDWFVKYDSFRHLVTKRIAPDSRILNLGCGNSPLSEEMYQDGFHNIVNVDYSEVIIAEMRERHKALPGMTWTVMDIRDMSRLESQSFDIVIEKGTLDALLVGETDPWHVSDAAENMIDTILTEISRLLRPGGQFISITFAQPHFRLPLYALPRYDWDIQTDLLGTHFHYFYFTMIKGQTLSESNLEVRASYLRRISQKHSPKKPSVSDSEDEDFLLKSVNVFESDDVRDDTTIS